MYNVTIQKQPKEPTYWEDIKSVPMTFKTWENVSDFAYRLSIIHGGEIRVEYKGNGHYYSPENAENYLKL